MIKKANKTVNIKKPEHKKMPVKTKAAVSVTEKKIKEGYAVTDTKKQSDIIKASQDTGWKRLITKHFESFLKFFYPDIHRDIDFKKGYEFLDKELQALIPESETGERTADKLVKVWLKSGAEEWLLIHIEVQGKKEERFEERMYLRTEALLLRAPGGRRRACISITAGYSGNTAKKSLPS